VGEDEFAGAGFDVAVVLATGEDRVAAEARAAALGAVRQPLGSADRELAAAVEAEEGAGARGGPGALALVEGVGADAVEDRWFLPGASLQRSYSRIVAFVTINFPTVPRAAIATGWP
jgi:hypothetical protein